MYAEIVHCMYGGVDYFVCIFGVVSLLSSAVLTSATLSPDCLKEIRC